eukprot:gene6969-biopygen4445
MTNKPYEIPAEMRDFAEKSVEQARKAFTGFLDAAQKATGSLVEGSSSAVPAKVTELGAQAAEFTEKSINAAFDHAQKLPLVKIENQIRSAAESAIVEGRKSFETAKVKAHGLTSAVEASAGTLSKGINDLNAKSISVLKTNIETGFDHMKALFGAKTIFDAWKLHADMSAKQLAVMNEQAKDLAAAASKFATESVQPIKNSLEQAFSR